MNSSKLKFFGDDVRLQIFFGHLAKMEADLGIKGPLFRKICNREIEVFITLV